jgi:replicative DNA helicase
MQNKVKLLGDDTNQEIVLPHNAYAEQEVIGGLLHDNNNINKVREFVGTGDFYLEHHKKLYDIIIKLIDKGKIADPVSISSNLANDQIFIDFGGIGYLKALVSDFLIGGSDIKQRAETIKDLALKRKLIEILMSNIREVVFKNDTDMKTEEQIEQIETQLFAMNTQGQKILGGFTSLKNALGETRRRIEKAKQKGGISGIDTGFVDLNEKIHGWQNSDLIIIAGRPSMGKTSFAISIALNAVKNIVMKKEYQESKYGGVGIFSLEMSCEQISGKILSMHTEVPVTELIGGRIDAVTLNKVIQAIPEIENYPIYIDDSPALTIGTIRTRARRLKQRYGLDLLVIDYLQLLRGSGSGRGDFNRVQEVSEVTQGLKAIAKELNIPVIALSQLSRNVESRDDKRPMLSDLRESGSIEQDADIVMFIYRDAYYLKRSMPPETAERQFAEWMEKNGQRLEQSANKSEIIVAKHRNGEVGNVLLYFDEETTKFDNLAIEAHDSYRGNM